MTNLDQIIRTDSHIARNAIAAEIHAHWNEIVDLCVERVEGVGLHEHGDASFHKPPSMLRRERFEEYADALFYFQMEHRTGG